MKCEACGREELMPYTCPYCKQRFCHTHRLPENHVCPGAPSRDPLGNYAEKNVVSVRVDREGYREAVRKAEDNRKLWRRIFRI